MELIGPLQSNKLKRALVVADRISSIDRVDLLAKVATASAGAPHARSIALQVNSDEDPAKAGFLPNALREALPEIAALVRGSAVEIDGLMMIGRLTTERNDSRRSFASFAAFARELRREAAALGLHIGPLVSAGMSGDFEIAVEEGATQVRLGSALFGARG